MVDLPPSLAGFFEKVVPVLRGTAPASTIARRERAGLAFYQHMTELEQRGLLERSCPGVARALELSSGGFADLARSYFRDRPPSGWDPGAVGESLGDYMRGRSQAPYLPEIADAHMLLRRAALASDGPGPTLEHTIFVRRFETTAPQFVKRLLAGEAPALPESKPMVALIYRSQLTMRAHVMLPDPDTVRALLAHESHQPAPEAALRMLRDRGVLPAATSQR